MASSSSPSTEKIDCPVCSDPIDSCFGVFDCGHFACYKCALKVRRTVRREANTSSNRRNNNNHNNHADSAAVTAAAQGLPAKPPATCYVCRKQIASLTITEMLPKNPDSFVYEKTDVELLTNLDHSDVKKFLPLNCFVTSDRCAAKLQSLIDFVCPFDQCWDVDKKTGEKSQIPFNNFDLLQRHLRQEHNGCKFCEVCSSQSVSFLQELTVYTPNELRNHMNGTSGKDSQAFTGHPSCQFCHNKTFIDGEAMLEHLKHVHYVCDFCNMTSYKFTYYNDREALNRHWAIEHKLCTHPECAELDPVARVFGNELDLARHMQERHNVKPKTLSMEAFGFRYNDAEITIPSRGSGNNSNNNANASAANLQQMATQAALGNTMITYDFVGSTRVLPLVPRTMNANDGTTSQQQNGRRKPQNNGGKGGKWKNNSNKNDDDDDQQQQQEELRKTQEENAKKEEALKKKIDEADETVRDIVSNLSNKNRDVFKDAAKRFIQQEIKAVEFFNIIQRVISDEDTLELLFDSFTETLRRHRNPSLRDALISAKSIVLSAEAKRAKEVSREEEQKVSMEKKKDQIRKLHSLTIVGGGGGSRGKPVSQSGGGNYWQQRSTPSVNPEPSNIYKKNVAAPSANNNPWAKKMNEQSAMANSSSGSGGNNSRDDSADFGYSFGGGDNGGLTTTTTAASSSFNKKSNNNSYHRRAVPAVEDDSPSLTEAFPTLPTTNRKGKPHMNQATQPKGAWKSGSKKI